MFATLGNIRFEGLKGFTAFSDSSATNFAEVARIGRKPTLHRVGEALESLSISILLHADFSNVGADFDELRQARKRGDSLPLVMGNGSVLGDYLITSISRDIRKTADDGSIIYLTADLELKEADTSNRLLAKEVADRGAAFANSLQKVIPTAQVPIEASAGVEAGALVQSVNIQTAKAGALVEKASNSPTGLAGILQQASAAADAANIAALEAANKIRLVQSQISTAEAILSDLEAVATFASDLAQAADSGVLADSIAASSTLQGANTALQASSSVLVQLIVLRRI